MSTQSDEPGREQADGATYPWVEDLDGRWHLRPADDPWITSMDGPNARTACGKAIASVHVSEFQPDPGEAGGCVACLSATAREQTPESDC